MTQADTFYEHMQEVEKAKACLEQAWKELPGILLWINKARAHACPEARPQITAIYNAVEVSMNGYEDVMDLLEEDRADWERRAIAASGDDRY